MKQIFIILNYYKSLVKRVVMMPQKTGEMI